MSAVGTLHVRNVPDELVDRFKRRAKENGRSLNAEIVAALSASAEEEERRGWVAQRLEELRAEFTLPKGAPDPADVIRQARDERAQEIQRRARGT